jgi:8-oxo-dGTP pyrophosphatase MutT (NUDIX family)
VQWAPQVPELAALVERHTPVATGRQVWGEHRDIPVKLQSYLGAVDVAESLVTSVRCLVVVDDRVVVCTNVTGARHPWPGGRLEPGETFVQTACREVREETGWQLEPETLRPLGWLHIEKQLDERPPDHAFPQKDFMMVVWTGRASEREGGRDNAWTDTEGFELSSELLTIGDAIRAVEPHDPTAVPFLRLLAGAPTPG